LTIGSIPNEKGFSSMASSMVKSVKGRGELN
jgi:hypothetical protein